MIGLFLITRLHVRFWRDRASEVKAKLNNLTSGSSYNFVESLVKRLISDGDDQLVQNAVSAASQLLQHIYRCENEVLTIDGIGKHYQDVESIARDVRLLITCLEDVLCNSLSETPSELQNMFHRHELMYQIQ